MTDSNCPIPDTHDRLTEAHHFLHGIIDEYDNPDKMRLRHTFHQLRHSAVNGVYRETKDTLLTQRFARHSSLLVTSVYLHPTDDDLECSVRRIRC